MNRPLLPNPERRQIGPYVVRFVAKALQIALASAPEQALVNMEMEAALELADWLALCRGRLYQTVMRDGLEMVKAQIRAGYHCRSRRSRKRAWFTCRRPVVTKR
ncbi:MAG TPA: hypothetical protein VNE61_08530 [Ktedonobacteraceae bacterium]|nr:hypothetical protein [Ktedonobacteraceae bacterium]